MPLGDINTADLKKAKITPFKVPKTKFFLAKSLRCVDLKSSDGQILVAAYTDIMEIYIVLITADMRNNMKLR